jgi:hypothetical protein
MALMLTLFDVGHGDSALLEGSDKSLLVDCGALIPSRHSHVPEEIERRISQFDSKLVITHYHWDHYSLIKLFKNLDKCFSEVYLPELPAAGPGSEVSRFLASFVVLASLSGLSYYRIIPELFRSKCRIRPVSRGGKIKALGQSLDVIWPDLKHNILNRGRIFLEARAATRRIEEVLKEAGIGPVPSESERETGNDESSENQGLLGWILHNTIEEGARLGDPATTGILTETEELFRKVSDRLSLAFVGVPNDSTRPVLFLGDLTNGILNVLGQTRASDIPSTELNIIKTAHHGTRFGKVLAGLKTWTLTISRNEAEFPSIDPVDSRYQTLLTPSITLNTERVGTTTVMFE